MDLDLSPLLSDLTAVAAVVVVLYLAFRAVKPFIDKAAESMAKMSDGYVGYVQAQVDVATAMRELCHRFDEAATDQEKRDGAQDERLSELAEAIREMGGVMRGLQQQQQAHEGRAAARHEQSLKRDEELLKALKALNGKS